MKAILSLHLCKCGNARNFAVRYGVLLQVEDKLLYINAYQGDYVGKTCIIINKGGGSYVEKGSSSFISAYRRNAWRFIFTAFIHIIFFYFNSVDQ